MNKLTVIVPFYNGHSYLKRLLKSLIHLPVIIVDDMSDKSIELQDWIGENVQIVRLEKKKYFTGAVNVGIGLCDTDVLILNQDVWFENSGWYGVLDQYVDRYAMIGERIAGTHPSFGELGYIHGTFMFLRRDAIKAVGLLNEKDYPLWGSTAEYQWRVARKNFRVLPLENIPGLRHERKEKEKYGSSIQEILKKEPENRSLLVRTPPLLSVVIPCYNYGHYLQDCINSLIGGPTNLGQMPGQTIQSFEVVIVDDASTDTTPEFVKQVVDISKGIRAFRLEKNVGTAKALNYGIERAVGKYITFLSADDMREPDSLENLVRVCEQNPHSFAYDDVWLFHTHKRIKKWEMPDYDFETLLYKNHVHAGIVFPKEAWTDVGGYPSIMNDGREDWAFNVALGIKGWCGVHLKQFGYLYRREGQNRTERNTTEEHRQKFLGKIMSLFPDVYGGYRPMACCGRGGANKKSNNGTVSSVVFRGTTMADSIGREGMVKIEYLGSQMMFTISGDTTNLNYTFGKDRQRGWVDKRDVGTRDGKTGFLSKKDRITNRWLYQVVGQSSVAVSPEPAKGVEVKSEVFETVVVSEAESVSTPTLQATLVPSARGNVTLSGTLSVVQKDFPDPTEMNVEEIKRLELTEEQWKQVYKAEMAGRNRKGAVGFIEEMLASFS